MTESAVRTRTPLDLQLSLDNVGGNYGNIWSSPENRKRAGNISFEYQHLPNGSGFYWVRAWGDLFPAYDAEYKGKLDRDEHSVFNAISHCRNIWQETVVSLKVPGGQTRRYRYPFGEWDLHNASDQGYLDQVGHKLARAGNTLYKYLFRQRDEELLRIADLLESALRSGEQVLAFHSNELFAPWWMLYTPPDPDVDLDDPDAPWSLTGFWGYQHWIEHQFSRLRTDSRIIVRNGTVHVGLNVDPGIDQSFETPFVERVVSFFRQTKGSDHTVRERKPQLALALKSVDFPDQIIYFGCHASVSGHEGAALSEARLTLADGEPIYTHEVCTWLSERPQSVLATNPIVFVNACQAGQMATQLCPSFGYEFIKHGGNCLLGPQIDLPVTFAACYATTLFKEFLSSGSRLGDVVRKLARDCAATRRNPLGLTYALYRGLDTRLVHEPKP